LMSLVTLLTILILYYRLKPTSKAVPSELPLDHTLLYIDIPFCGTPSILEWAMSHAKEPCGCKDGVCQCIDRNTPWLVSKHTTTCGTNPSYTNLKQCSHYEEGAQYLATLCNPVLRTLREFEFQKTQRTNFWSYCNDIKRYEHSSCSKLQTLDQFLSCHNNPALNRQVRMLSDTTCAFTEITPNFLQAMLESAIMNLEKFYYVGIQEYWNDSVTLLMDVQPWFDAEVQPTGLSDSLDNGISDGIFDGIAQYNISEDMVRRIRRANEGDMKLWYHALRLFSARTEYAGIRDTALHDVQYPTDVPGPYDKIIDYYVYLVGGRYKANPDDIYI